MVEAALASPNALVSGDWLLAHLDDPEVRIVEVDVARASYADGHISGAVFWNIYTDLKDEKYRLVDSAALETILSDSGIAPHTRVVFYGYGPALGYWLLRLYRHENVSILNFAALDVLHRIFPEQPSRIREVVTYCTIGNRASVAWFVLSEMLGRSGVRVYDGSWAEWGHMADTRVEK